MKNNHTNYLKSICPRCNGLGVLTLYQAGCVQVRCPVCNGSGKRPACLVHEGRDTRAEAGRESTEVEAAS